MDWVLCPGSPKAKIEVSARLCSHWELGVLFQASVVVSGFRSFSCRLTGSISLLATSQALSSWRLPTFLALGPSNFKARNSLPHIEIPSCYKSLPSGKAQSSWRAHWLRQVTINSVLYHNLVQGMTAPSHTWSTSTLQGRVFHRAGTPGHRNWGTNSESCLPCLTWAGPCLLYLCMLRPRTGLLTTQRTMKTVKILHSTMWESNSIDQNSEVPRAQEPWPILVLFLQPKDK